MADKKDGALRKFGRWILTLLLKNSWAWGIIFGALQGLISQIAKINFTGFKLWVINNLLLASLTATILVVGFGALVSYWKMHALRSYASVEVLVGALLGFNSASHLAPEFNFGGLLGILSAVYVAARGFNNLSSARLVAAGS